MRKIIQVCCAISDAPGNSGRERLYALCDDGTLFGQTPKDGKGRWGWEALPPVPQPPEPKDVSAIKPNERFEL